MYSLTPRSLPGKHEGDSPREHTLAFFLFLGRYDDGRGREGEGRGGEGETAGYGKRDGERRGLRGWSLVSCTRL